jgi:hypothetical protein
MANVEIVPGSIKVYQLYPEKNTFQYTTVRIGSRIKVLISLPVYNSLLQDTYIYISATSKLSTICCE